MIDQPPSPDPNDRPLLDRLREAKEFFDQLLDPLCRESDVVFLWKHDKWIARSRQALGELLNSAHDPGNIAIDHVGGLVVLELPILAKNVQMTTAQARECATILQRHAMLADRVKPACSGCDTPTIDRRQDHPGVCECGGYITDDHDDTLHTGDDPHVDRLTTVNAALDDIDSELDGDQGGVDEGMIDVDAIRELIENARTALKLFESHYLYIRGFVLDAPQPCEHDEGLLLREGTNDGREESENTAGTPSGPADASSGNGHENFPGDR